MTRRPQDEERRRLKKQLEPVMRFLRYVVVALAAAAFGCADNPAPHASGNSSAPAASQKAYGRAKGRLPPEQIQKVVRDEYDRFRRCYEVGLARNPNLEGKVIVRFVINEDGTVSDVKLEEGTTLSDKQAIDCMLSGYRSLTFPRPDGGIVTVVYPIAFSPG